MMAYQHGLKKPDTNDHVAIYMASLGMGGAQRVTLNLARSLARRGLKIDLVLGQAEERYLAQIPPDINIVNLGCRHALRSLPALVYYLKKTKPHFLLSVMHYANIVSIWSRRLADVSTRLVITEHSVRIPGTSKIGEYANIRSYLKDHILKFCMTHFYPWADYVVAVSHGVADALSEHLRFPRGGIQVIYNAVLTEDVFKKAEEQPSHFWFRTGEPPIILAAGRLEPEKDYPTLLFAFARVRQHGSARLLILGEGSERAKLERLVQQLGLSKDVSLPGIVDNPYMYMARASVFVLSSAWEGLPTVLIEALALGVPVISTRCPTGPEEILENGCHGMLIPVGDSKLLASAIHNIILSPPRPVIDFSFLDRFRPEETADKYLQILGVNN